MLKHLLLRGSLLLAVTLPPSLHAADTVHSALDDPKLQKVEAFQVFDNLYYVGAKWVGSWLLKTSEGLILIDSLYGDLVDITLDGIKAQGLQAEDIRYVLVSHAHFDHIGGAKYYQDQFDATVAMVEEDWQLAAGKAVYKPYPKPRRQLVIEDGQRLTLGDTTIEFFKTPGHSPGVMSMKFTVYDQGKPYTALMFGGAGLNFSGVERSQSYLASVSRLLAMEDIDVNIPNHAQSGDVFNRFKALQNRRPGELHSFVDPAAMTAWLEDLLSKAQQKLLREQALAAKSN